MPTPLEDFPNSPASGDVHPDKHGQNWTWNGVSWVRTIIGRGISEAPMDNFQYAREGQQWRKLAPEELFLGSFVTAPLLDNYAKPLVAGHLYFNTGEGKQKTWDGSAWLAFASTVSVGNARNFIWTLASDLDIGTPLSTPDDLGNVPSAWKNGITDISVYLDGKKLLEDKGTAVIGGYSVDYAASQITPVGALFPSGTVVSVLEYYIAPVETGLHPYAKEITYPNGSPVDKVTIDTGTRLILKGGNFDQTTKLISNTPGVSVTQFKAISDNDIEFFVHAATAASFTLTAYNDDRIAFGETFDFTVEEYAYITQWNVQPENQGQPAFLDLERIFYYQLSVKPTNQDFRINWGDGITEENTLYHDYDVPGIYTISISGLFYSHQYDATGLGTGELLKVIQLGNVEWNSFENMYKGATTLEEFNTGNYVNFPYVESCTSMFENVGVDVLAGCNLNLGAITHTSNVTCESMYANCNTTLIDYSASGGIGRQLRLIRAFALCTAQTIIFPTNTTTVVAFFYAAFSNMPNLTSLDLSSLDVAECDTFGSLVDTCLELTSVDVSGWSPGANLSNEPGEDNSINFSSSFSNCPKLTSVNLNAMAPFQKSLRYYNAFYGTPWSTIDFDNFLLKLATEDAQSNIYLNSFDAPITQFTDTTSYMYCVNDASINIDSTGGLYQVAPLKIETEVLGADDGSGYTFAIQLIARSPEQTAQGIVSIVHRDANGVIIKAATEIAQTINNTNMLLNLGFYDAVFIDAKIAVEITAFSAGSIECNNSLVSVSNKLEVTEVTDFGDIDVIDYLRMFQSTPLRTFAKTTTTNINVTTGSVVYMLSGIDTLTSINFTNMPKITNAEYLYAFTNMQNISNFNTMDFSECTSINGILGYAYNLDLNILNNITFPLVAECKEILRGAFITTSSDLAGLRLPSAAIINGAFMEIDINSSVPPLTINMSAWGIPATASMWDLCRYTSLIKEIILPTNLIPSSASPNSATLAYSFYNCSNITRVNLQDLDMSNYSEDLDTLFATSSSSLTSTLEAPNYDAILISWAAQILQSGITVDFGNSKYNTTAAQARADIIANFGWTIYDGGPV